METFPKKPANKATGLDGWKIKEIQVLPPCAWKAIKLFFTTVEASGKWPKSFHLVSITAIPKTHEWTPESTRAIGITSIFYSFWASVRFKQLAPWLGNLAPPSLAGGLPHRSATPSEIELSSHLFDSDEAPDNTSIVIFIDRWKCFDLLLPKFCIQLGSTLGLPSHICQPLTDFYNHQVKFFKLNNAYGNQVLHSNGVVQGCAFSVLFANLIFSVFAKRIEQFPGVTFSAFIDDTKLWASKQDLPELIKAATVLEAFDQAIGQVQNNAKSALLTKKAKDADRFLLQVGKQIPHRKRVKSLGFQQAVTTKGLARAVDLKTKAAAATIRKMGKLPFPAKLKSGYIKTAGHSRWLYGSEVAPPNKKAFNYLRIAVVNTVFPKKNRMRCPFLTMSTWDNVWVDPWAIWVRHVLLTYRKLHRRQPDLVAKVFRQARQIKPYAIRTSSGAPAVLAAVVRELEWEWADGLSFKRPGDTDFKLLYGSNKFFDDDLERSVRRSLFRRSPIRHDNLGDSRDGVINMFATRFFLDNDFSTVVPAPGLVEQLRNLPVKLDHAQNIIQNFLAGSIFDGPRKFKAGLVNSRKCEHCDADDDLLHMSKHCPTNPPPEVSVQMPDTSWTMGVLWESERDTQFRLQQDQPFQFGDLPPKHVLQPGDRIFTDGSFIRSKSGRLESAACSVYIPQILQLARPLPGLDQSSQRAELGAILLALKVTDGDAHIFTDCATIVKGFREQSRNAQGFSSLRSWDNFDLWTLIAAETSLNHRTVHVSKVSAHGRDPSQDPGLTEGNEKADALAKSLCQRQFQQHSDHSVCDVNCILAVQIHLIKSFVNRNLLTQPPDHDQIVDRALSTLKVATARKCTCPPSRRIRGKAPAPVLCRGTCLTTLVVGELERCFLNLLNSGAFVPNRIWDALKQQYPKFNQWVTHRTAVVQGLDVSNSPVPKAVSSPHCADAIHRFMREAYWCSGTSPITAFTPWSIVLIDFISRLGFVSPLFNQDMGFGRLIHRCHRYLKDLISEALPGIDTSVINNTLGSSFGLRCQVALGIHLVPVNPTNVWSIYVQACLYCSSSFLDGKKFRSSWKPDWGCFDTRM